MHWCRLWFALVLVSTIDYLGIGLIIDFLGVGSIIDCLSIDRLSTSLVLVWLSIVLVLVRTPIALVLIICQNLWKIFLFSLFSTVEIIVIVWECTIIKFFSGLFFSYFG